MRRLNSKYIAIDLFSGCGGLTQGMKQSGFQTKVAIEIESDAAVTFKLNHKETEIIQKDIRLVTSNEIIEKLNGQTIHLLAGCPPCQGFSSLRRLNRKKNKKDNRNKLILEYLRLVKELKPLTIMMENVPGLEDYYLFKDFLKELELLNYKPKVKVVNVKDYGVPQRRKRLVLVGSRLGKIEIASPNVTSKTVREAFATLESNIKTNDIMHKIFPKHSEKILERIKLTPHNGGSWKDLPEQYILKCHKSKRVGFNDVYGRLKWDDYSSTITGGCLNPSKGRFLHPEKDRCITAREAALLQSFPRNYKFPVNISKTSLALLIGNALPPKLSYYQSKNIKEHLDKYLG